MSDSELEPEAEKPHSFPPPATPGLDADDRLRRNSSGG